MKYTLSIGILCCLLACQTSHGDEVLFKELALAKEEISQLKDELSNKGAMPQKVLTHTLYFNLKKDLTEEQIKTFEDGLRSLSKIETAKGVKVGKTAETEDKRLISDYDYVLTMYFENEEDLQMYSHNDFHLKVRAEVGPMLEKAPIVYDSWVD